MKCDDCKFCILEDYGYSNYTVEGTNADCLLNMNPWLPDDHRWGEADSMVFANICPRFKEGSAIEMDVENNGNMLHYTDDPEARSIIEKQMMWEILNEKDKPWY